MSIRYKTNIILWSLVLILNLLISLFGILIITCACLIVKDTKKLETLGILLLLFGSIVFILSLTIFFSRYKKYYLYFIIVFHLILLVVIVVISIYLSTGYEDLINFVVNNLNISKKEEMLIKHNIANNIEVIKIGSYVIIGIMVS